MRTITSGSILVAVALLSGCATCERHPVACGAAVGFVATSIAISVNATRSSRDGGQVQRIARGQPCPNGTGRDGMCQ